MLLWAEDTLRKIFINSFWLLISMPPCKVVFMVMGLWLSPVEHRPCKAGAPGSNPGGSIECSYLTC